MRPHAAVLPWSRSREEVQLSALRHAVRTFYAHGNHYQNGLSYTCSVLRMTSHQYRQAKLYSHAWWIDALIREIAHEGKVRTVMGRLLREETERNATPSGNTGVKSRRVKVYDNAAPSLEDDACKQASLATG
jgi:lysyl-tRNA synthetase class I